MLNRRYERIVVDKEVECEIAGSRDFAFLYNLSVGGCMIEVDPSTAYVGCVVKMNLAGLEEIEGRIAWLRDRNAGVQFDRTISDAVVQYLGFEISLLPFAELQPRDRFGNPLQSIG